MEEVALVVKTEAEERENKDEKRNHQRDEGRKNIADSEKKDGEKKNWKKNVKRNREGEERKLPEEGDKLY